MSKFDAAKARTTDGRGAAILFERLADEVQWSVRPRLAVDKLRLGIRVGT